MNKVIRFLSHLVLMESCIGCARMVWRMYKGGYCLHCVSRGVRG